MKRFYFLIFLCVFELFERHPDCFVYNIWSIGASLCLGIGQNLLLDIGYYHHLPAILGTIGSIGYQGFDPSAFEFNFLSCSQISLTSFTIASMWRARMASDRRCVITGILGTNTRRKHQQRRVICVSKEHTRNNMFVDAMVMPVHSYALKTWRVKTFGIVWRNNLSKHHVAEGLQVRLQILIDLPVLHVLVLPNDLQGCEISVLPASTQ